MLLGGGEKGDRREKKEGVEVGCFGLWGEVGDREEKKEDVKVGCCCCGERQRTRRVKRRV